MASSDIGFVLPIDNFSDWCLMNRHYMFALLCFPFVR